MLDPSWRTKVTTPASFGLFEKLETVWKTEVSPGRAARKLASDPCTSWIAVINEDVANDDKNEISEIASEACDIGGHVHSMS